MADRLGNEIAREGMDRCSCGCKYWENDVCIDCGAHVTSLPRLSEAAEAAHRALLVAETALEAAIKATRVASNTAGREDNEGASLIWGQRTADMTDWAHRLGLWIWK